MFQKASRYKLRFDSPQGGLTTEDLWDIPLQSARGANLDDIAKHLHKQISESNVTSFVSKKATEDTVLQLKFDIVKHIIETRLAEADTAAVAQANKQKKQQLLGIIAMKEQEQLMGSSLDDLKKMVESL